MSSNRINQVNETIRKILAEAIIKDIDLPPDILITITHALASPNFKQCRVLVSILPESMRGSGLKILNNNRKRLYQILKSKLATKFTPNLEFEIDQQEVFAGEVDKILDELT